MAYAITPTPGDEYLCANPCKHKDCAEHRATIAADCYYCNKPIGAGVKWMVQHDSGLPCHAECSWAKLEDDEEPI